MELISILAILISPLVAVMVTTYLQNRREKRQARLWIFNTLIATRHSSISEEAVRALNMIDVVFHDSARIRALWREYFEMLCNEGLNNPLGWGQRQKKNLELITEMAKALGYGSSITHLDVDRVYSPIWLGVQSQRAQAITEELLRVLRSTSGLQVLSSEKPESPGSTPMDSGSTR